MLALNIPVAGDHVREVKQCIWVIKEHAQGIVCTLLYPCLLQQMFLHLLHFVMMWLNNFPTSNGISADFSPRKIILRHHLSYKRHCRAPFGACCKTHEDNAPINSMRSRALPAICLGPTGNLQGRYHFLNLVTGSVIKPRTFDELPVPQSIIDHVTALAAKSGVSSNLIFADSCRVPFEWSTKHASVPPITPVAPYPGIPAKMPGVLINRHQPTQDAPPVPPCPHEPDWEQMADKAVDNADLELTELVPPPPKVITINDDDNNYQVPVVASTSQLPCTS
jgi:hypothetical protein